jgi:hypothetical protein
VGFALLSFMFMFCRSLFVLFVWPLCCLSFDLRVLIIPLVSSNSSYLIQLTLTCKVERFLCILVSFSYNVLID